MRLPQTPHARRWRTFCLMTGFALLAGCASSSEKQAFDRWIEADKAMDDHAPAAQSHAADTAAATSPDVFGHDHNHANNTGKQAENSASSQPASLDVLTAYSTADDYANYALTHNPGLGAALSRWKAALEKVPQMRSLADPKFSYQRDGSFKQDTYSLMQMFMWPGRLDAESTAMLEMAHSSEQMYQAQRLALAARVKKMLAERWYLQRALLVNERNQSVLSQVEQQANLRLSSGLAAQSDVIRAQLECERAKTELLQMRLMLAPMDAELNAMLGRPTGASLPPAPAPSEAGDATDINALIATMHENSPDLRSMQHELDSAHAAVQAAKLSRVPDVEIAGMYMNDDYGMEAKGAQVTITLPIWNEKYDAKNKEALANLRAATRNLADKTLMMEADLRGAWAGVEDAQRRIDLYGKTLGPKGQQYLESLLANYISNNAASSSISNLIEAEHLQREFELNKERAMADRQIRIAQIEALIGQRISTQETQRKQP